jgi:hypothetical protein
MTDVSEWAKREAVNPHMPPPNPEWQGGAVWVAERMAALLLSDEAVEAALRGALDAIDDYDQWATPTMIRAALTAALTKITEDNE